MEEGAPDIIIPPQGFQAIEEILFSNNETGYHKQLGKLADGMLTILNKMENEPERIYKFRNELVWDAIRSAAVRLAALGITGFDSPVALKSLTEAKASIGGMKNILLLFKNDIDRKYPNATSSLLNLLDKAIAYLQTHSNFDNFDRLDFIARFINPFYRQLNHTRIKAGIAVPEGQSPVNYSAASIFQEDFFNINFFSPGKEYWITDKRIELGKKLFSDPILSGTKDRSCASCHSPGKSFTDGLMVPYALDNKTLLTRNTPTLWNAALQTRQFLDTRSAILEDQLKEVVHNTDEMKGSLQENVDDLKAIQMYVHSFYRGISREKVNLLMHLILPMRYRLISGLLLRFVQNLTNICLVTKQSCLHQKKMDLTCLRERQNAPPAILFLYSTASYHLNSPKQKQRCWAYQGLNQKLMPL